MTLPPKNQRSNFIDCLRGMAACSVLLFHYFGYLKFSASPLSTLEQFVLWVTSFGYLGVPAFFAISGYVLAMTSAKVAFTPSISLRFFSRRFVRVAVPYWVMVAIIAGTLLIGKSFGRFSTIELSLPQVLLHLCYFQEIAGVSALDGAFWTLCLEIQFYAIFSISLVAFHYFRVSRETVFNLCVISALSSLALHWFKYFAPCWSPVLWYQFAFGIIAFQASTTSSRRWLTAAFFSTVCFVGVVAGKPELAVSAMIAFLMFINRQSSILESFVPSSFVFLGSISYSLYLIHGFVGMPLNMALKSVMISLFLSPIAVVSLAVGFVIPIAWLFFRFIEKPSMDWSKRIAIPH